MWNAELDEAQAGIKIAGWNTNNFRYADDITLMAESKKELKSFLMKVKEESEKAGLKFNIQKSKIMASSPLATSWQTEGEKVETVTDVFSWALKLLRMVTVAMKWKDAAPWKKSYDKPRQCMKKKRHHLWLIHVDVWQKPPPYCKVISLELK